MTKTYELPNEKMIMADIDEKHHMATVSVYALDDLVEAVNKTGYWRHYEGMLTCSECGAEFYDDIMEYCGDDVPKYCPNCGAKMVEPQERSDNE